MAWLPLIGVEPTQTPLPWRDCWPPKSCRKNLGIDPKGRIQAGSTQPPSPTDPLLPGKNGCKHNPGAVRPTHFWSGTVDLDQLVKLEMTGPGSDRRRLWPYLPPQAVRSEKQLVCEHWAKNKIRLHEQGCLPSKFLHRKSAKVPGLPMLMFDSNIFTIVPILGIYPKN